MAKTIAVLTSGGDAPGMNAAVRAVARAALLKFMVFVEAIMAFLTAMYLK